MVQKHWQEYYLNSAVWANSLSVGKKEQRVIVLLDKCDNIIGINARRVSKYLRAVGWVGGIGKCAHLKRRLGHFSKNDFYGESGVFSGARCGTYLQAV